MTADYLCVHGSTEDVLLLLKTGASHMSLWRQFARGCSVLIHGHAADQDVADEVEHYLEEATSAWVARGLSPQDARRAARLELGSPSVAREQVRSSGWEHTVRTVLSDLHYAARQLLRNRGFALVTSLTLALGIGASTAIFSAVNPILFEPLPYPHAGQLMTFSEIRGDGGAARPVSFGTFRGLQERSRSFDAMAVMKPWQPAMVGSGQPERFEGQRVSADYFRALGIPPALGRDFRAADDQFHGPNVVVLSDRLWRLQFAADRTIVGQQIKLDDNLFTVIGVMPGWLENVLAPGAELWAPLQYDQSLPADGREWGHHLRMVGRLRPGVSEKQATNELKVILRPLAQMYANGYDHSGGSPDGFLVHRLQDDITRAVKPALLAILGAVGLVLLIVCVNVTNLLLALGARRRGEFAMRAALGAGRMRMIRQVLTESLLLAAIGGVLGLGVAAVGVRALVALAAPGLPRAGAIHIDSAVFGFGLVITTTIGLMVGLLPALQSSRSDPRNGLQQSSRTSTGGRQSTRRALAVSEIALALVLLVTAGLVLRSLETLFAVDPGFDASHLLTMQVQRYGHRFDNAGAHTRSLTQALEAVRQVGGVESAAFTGQLPLSGDFDVYGVQFESHTATTEGALCYAVSPGYFETTGISLRRGRFFDERDTADTPGVVVVSESLAKSKFPSQDPIGQRVRVGPNTGHAEAPWETIVGVVGDVKQASLAVSQTDAFYVPTIQSPWADDAQSLVVRTRGDPAAAAAAVKSAIWSVDKDQPIVRVATMASLLTSSEADRRFALTLFETFGMVALVLAAIGIYGVLSGGVTERMREIGVRAALGASRRNILLMVIRQGMTLTGIGIVIGLLGALIASQVIVSLLYGVSRFDPVTYLSVIALLTGVSAIACWVPAWRAAQVDPSITLRAE
jgi:putative ABC transport system permease protein